MSRNHGSDIMGWLGENWFFVLFLIAFVVMHLFGHGHGGHGHTKHHHQK